MSTFKEWYPKTAHAELSKRNPESGMHNRFANWSRYELQEFLESRGFAVCDDEPIDDLREAAYLEVESWSSEN